MADPTPTPPTSTPTVPVAVLGTDALLAALPATPVQLAHACMRAGFASVIPASWGDELIAAAALRRLPRFGSSPVIQCSCPIVAHRLLTVGGDLRPVLLALVPPPVAVARYMRTLSVPTRLRITYVGACPGAADESIDIRMTPDALLDMLAERQISPEDQPRVFEAVIPPDRRRFRSQPGGLPASDALWSELGARTLVELGGDDLVTEIAQHLLTGKNVLIDAAVRLGCACSGAAPEMTPSSEARARVVALEPPRATSPVIEERAPIDLDSHVPAASRTPIDVAAVTAASAPPHLVAAAGTELSFGNRISPVRGVTTVIEPRAPRSSNPGMSRPVQGSVPVSRAAEGRSLPRAYIARRRSSPRGIQAITSAVDETATAPSPVPMRRDEPATGPKALATTRLPWPLSPRQVVYLIAAAAILVIGLSTVIGVVVGRSIGTPSAATTQR